MKQKLRDKIAKGKIKEVIADLLTATTSNADLHNRVLQLSARYAEYEKKYLGNLEAPSVLNVELARINHAALAIIDELDLNDNTYLSEPPIMMKHLIYALAALLAFAAIWFIYAWFKAEPDNREPLPALLSALSSMLLVLYAWRSETAANNEGSKKTPFFRRNKADINGKNITVKQGTKSGATIETNNLNADGEGHHIEQG